MFSEKGNEKKDISKIYIKGKSTASNKKNNVGFQKYLYL